jgi:hypothetical protein
MKRALSLTVSAVAAVALTRGQIVKDFDKNVVDVPVLVSKRI